MPTVILPDVTVTLAAHTCGQCGIIFGMTEKYIADRKNDHETWYCPNGHARAFTGQSEAERLRDELAREKHRTEQATARAEDEARRRRLVIEQKDAVERSLRATKAVVTRTKKKIVAGRCPCCSTQFKDLKSHMATRHPNYDPEKAVVALEAKQ